jgi:hypothetical protein
MSGARCFRQSSSASGLNLRYQRALVGRHGFNRVEPDGAVGTGFRLREMSSARRVGAPPGATDSRRSRAPQDKPRFPLWNGRRPSASDPDRRGPPDRAVGDPRRPKLAFSSQQPGHSSKTSNWPSRLGHRASLARRASRRGCASTAYRNVNYPFQWFGRRRRPAFRSRGGT